MIEFGAISYAVVGVVYTILCILLVTSWRGKQVGGYFIVACTLSAIWAFTLCAQSAGSPIPPSLLFLFEALRGGAWLAFLAALLAKIGVSRWVLYLMHGTWIGALAVGALWWIGQYLSGPLTDVTPVAIPGGLLIALAGLISIEQLFRNTSVESRWSMKTLALGLGGLFAYDLFLYSQGMLFGALDATTWLARGAANIFFVPLIALAARRNPDWELNIFVSRQVVFYSTSLTAVGVYLLLMSLGGYALVLYGGTWGEILQLIFFVGAILVLIALLFSTTIRARIKVFLSKHFFQNKYDYREEWLRLIATMSGLESRATRQIVVKAMAQIVNSPGGSLWTVDDGENSLGMVSAFQRSELPQKISVDGPLVSFIRKEGWLIDLEEYNLNPKLYRDLAVPNWLIDDGDVWLIVPLLFRQEMVGLVMLDRAPGPPKLNYEDRDLLKTVGNHIAVHLEQEKSDNLLAEAQQFEAYNKLTAFLMHDLNNLIAQQSLIIKNAEKHKRNPEFVDDAMRTIANSVSRMKRVMDQLKRSAADSTAKLTELRFIVSTAVDRCSGKEPVPTLDLDGVDASLKVDPEQFTMVLTHLIKNAQDATDADGRVSVQAIQLDHEFSVTISDTGCGMSPEYVRRHLFKPFDSTKGSQGMGIGAYQAREFTRRLGGDLSVESAISKGTTIKMTLPMQKDEGHYSAKLD